jgi:hypothetical protein
MGNGTASIVIVGMLTLRAAVYRSFTITMGLGLLLTLFVLAPPLPLSLQ